MAPMLANFLKNMPSPILLLVAGYIGLRCLEIALKPHEAFRTRMAHALMTLSAIGLFLLSMLFAAGEILRATGVMALPWPASSMSKETTTVFDNDITQWISPRTIQLSIRLLF
jgi:hypothetical protein